MITRELSPMSPALSAIVEYHLVSTEEGTTLSKLFAKPTGPFLGRTLIRLLAPIFRRIGKQAFETFKREIENDYLEHSEALESDAGFTGEQIREAAAASLQAGEIENDYLEHSEALESDAGFTGEQIREAAAASLQAASGSLQT
jgi:hypothetical protein